MTIGNRLTLILVVFCATSVLANIDFPGDEDDSVGQKNAENKKPVYAPKQCGENELLYPGDHPTDYVCDCKPGFIYYPMTNLCYSPYRQGPCQPNQYLMIASGQYIPECLPNRCSTDGLVTFRNKCYLLNEPGPCELAVLTYVVAVNSSTLELACIQQNPDLTSRFGDDEPDDTYGSSCLRGSRRSIEGKCKD